jgi:hypothetical protein
MSAQGLTNQFEVLMRIATFSAALRGMNSQTGANNRTQRQRGATWGLGVTVHASYLNLQCGRCAVNRILPESRCKVA